MTVFELVNLVLLYLILVPILSGVLTTIALDRRSSLRGIPAVMVDAPASDILPHVGKRASERILGRGQVASDGNRHMGNSVAVDS